MTSMSSNDQRAISNGEEDEESGRVRDIYALTTPDHHPQHPIHRGRPRDASWSSQSTAVSEGGTPSENFSTMSREFNALVIAGSALDGNGNGGAADSDGGGGNNLTRIGEDEEEMINPLAIVPDPSSSNGPIMGRDPDPRRVGGTASLRGSEAMTAPPSVQRVKKDEVEAKITAWQTAELAKVNNRFKREDAVINGWEGEKVQRATSRMKKVERKLQEKRARAREKMENEVAKAHRKAEERRASAEAKRGTKVARVLELANLMRAVGKPPVKRSFF